MAGHPRGRKQLDYRRRHQRAQPNVELEMPTQITLFGFWENLFEELVIWNEEEATRHSPNAQNHSIIDVTASTPGIDLEWAMGGAEEATGSDHEVLFWR